MSFIASKLLWALAQPSNLLVFLLLIAALFAGLGRMAIARGLVTFVIALMLIIGILPLGHWLIQPLEERFPEPMELPSHVDGVIVLGGAVAHAASLGRERLALNGSAERVSTLIELGRRYPEAKLVYSGGLGNLLNPAVDIEAMLRRYFATQGIASARIMIEPASRNTFENALFSQRLVMPKTGERWLLVTSAFHMPRSVGIFRKLGWDVIAVPVDHQTVRLPGFPFYANKLAQFDLGTRLGELDLAVRAWIGLAAYWYMDRTSALFPKPAA